MISEICVLIKYNEGTWDKNGTAEKSYNHLVSKLKFRKFNV
jgi:hypothetical protein